MARTNEQGLLLQGNIEHKTRIGVIWMRGYDHDPATLEAQVSAMKDYECRQVQLKNELWYEGYVDPVDVCYTDDPGITRDFKAAGIEVVQLRALTDEEKKAREPVYIDNVNNAESTNEALKSQLAQLIELQRMQMESNTGKVEQKAPEKTPDDKEGKTNSTGKQPDSANASKKQEGAAA